MAEFVQTMKDWRRMCKVYTVFKHECEGCPLENIAEHACGAIFEPEFADVVDWAELKKIVDEWAADHPEPKYPTWAKVLAELDIVIVETAVRPNACAFYENSTTNTACQYVQRVTTRPNFYRPIPADIAEKLGIKPREADYGD